MLLRYLRSESVALVLEIVAIVDLAPLVLVDSAVAGLNGAVNARGVVRALDGPGIASGMRRLTGPPHTLYRKK